MGRVRVPLGVVSSEAHPKTGAIPLTEAMEAEALTVPNGWGHTF